MYVLTMYRLLICPESAKCESDVVSQIVQTIAKV